MGASRSIRPGSSTRSKTTSPDSSSRLGPNRAYSEATAAASFGASSCFRKYMAYPTFSSLTGTNSSSFFSTSWAWRKRKSVTMSRMKYGT